MPSLTESDYLSILGLIQKFHDCQTRSELKLCFQEDLLPLINADKANYMWTDHDIQNDLRNCQNIDMVGYESKYEKAINKVPEYLSSLKKIVAETSLNVMGTDTTIARKEMKSDIEQYFEGNPEFKKEDYPDLANFEGAIALIDRADFMVGVGFQKIAPNTEAFTQREVRVMELLHPHILQCIKTIFLNEELKRYKSLISVLTESSTPLGLISLDFRIIFRNPAFSGLLTLEKGQKLPRDIVDTIKKETSQYDPSHNKTDCLDTELSFVRLPKGVFRLVVSLLNRGEEETQCWLLRLKPAVEPFSKMNFLMQDRGLTKREIEVASLIRDGMDDQAIGDHLFISIHTVKNHIKNIHQKLEVHTRARLVAILNQNKEDSLVKGHLI